MIKQKAIGIILILTVLSLFSACGQNTGSPKKTLSTSVPQTQSRLPDISEPLDLSEASTADEILPEKAETPLFDEAEIIARLENVANACSDIVNGFKSSSTSDYPDVTPEEYARMREAIGSLGFPVSHYTDDSMMNSEKVVDFYKDAQTGKDTRIIICEILYSGIRANVLACYNGDTFFNYAYYNFPLLLPQPYSDKRPKYKVDNRVYEVDNMLMNERGQFLFRIREQDGLKWEDKGYQILPWEIDEEQQSYFDELYDKYLEIAVDSGITTYSWENASEIKPESLVRFFGAKTELSWLSTDAVSCVVPEDIVEAFIRRFFDVDSSHIRKARFYNEDKQDYELPMMPGGPGAQKVLGADVNGAVLTLFYEYYSSANGIAVTLEGKLKIEFPDEFSVGHTKYKYISCEITDLSE